MIAERPSFVHKSMIRDLWILAVKTTFSIINYPINYLISQVMIAGKTCVKGSFHRIDISIYLNIFHQQFPYLRYRHIFLQTDWHSTAHCFHTKHSNCPEYGRSPQHTFLLLGLTSRRSMELLSSVNRPDCPEALLQDKCCKWSERNTKLCSPLGREIQEQYICY